MELYRTARDISPNVYLEMASDRAAYIDQSEVMPVDICTEDPAILVSRTFFPKGADFPLNHADSTVCKPTHGSSDSVMPYVPPYKTVL